MSAERLTAIDRSTKMIAAAAAAQRRARRRRPREFLVAELEHLHLGDRRFDLVFAVRVGLFHREPDARAAWWSRGSHRAARVRAFFDPPSSGAANRRR